MYRQKFVGVLTVILFLAIFFLGPISQPSRALALPTNHVQIAATDVVAARALGLSPVVAVDYDSFHWLELSDADLAKLAASGVSFTQDHAAGTVQVNRYQFDPVVEGEPVLAAGMRASQNGAGFRFIQVVGPTSDAWLETIQANGLEILQYYPYHTYLVWDSGNQIDRIEAAEFVRWTGLLHPAYKQTADLDRFTGRIDNLDVMFYNDGDIQGTLNSLAAVGANILNVYPSQPDQAFFNAIIELDAAAMDQMAQLETVLWFGYSDPEPILDDEMSAQIVAGNHPGGTPVLGYNSFLTDLGYDGSGVIWAINDTGVDYNHPDLNTRIVGGHNYPGCNEINPGDDPSTGGHGTHVAGIIGGDATGGFTDVDGFLYGLGVAPAYSIFAQNPICGTQSSWPPAGGWQELSKQAILGGAIGGNNSWTTGEGTQHGYQASERTHDIMVRDGNFDTASTAEPFIEVFSAGNSGASGLTAPKEGKNLIVTASSDNFRVGSIDNISGFSSRGPAVDGRWVPTISAPGAQIASTRNDDGGSCGTAIAGTSNLYSFCSGTSMAAPHTSGVIVLVTEWWRGFAEGGADPSPAMAKALLVNGAVDMGTADIPNIDEGWGRISIPNIISPTTQVEYRDQEHVFGATGEQFTFQAGVADPTQPLRITIAWSDAPGAVGANPALVNNLDLTVTVGGSTYLGNDFANGWSTTGGSADTLNNLENVFVQNPTGSITVVVAATNIAGDGVPYNADITDQDFVLVCNNCALFPDFGLSSTPSQLDICAPTDAVYNLTIDQILGYSDDVTLSAMGNPAGTNASFSTNPVTPPGTADLTIGSTGSAAAGNYAIDVVGVATTSTHTITVGLDLYDSAPSGQLLTSPPDAATGVSFRPVLEWQAATQGQDYFLEVALDNAFTNVIISETVTSLTYTPGSNLQSSTTYYWRVTPGNVCGGGTVSAVYSFTVQDSESLACNAPTVSFAEGIPAGWTVVDNSSGSGIVWTTISDSACGIGNQTGGSDEGACADSDAAGSGAPAYDTALVTDMVDITGLKFITLDFNGYYRDLGAGNDIFGVDMWDGSSWINMLSWDSTHPAEAVSLDAALPNSDMVQFRFTYSGNGFDWYAQVDDVSISCSAGTPMYLPIVSNLP